jgi:hypothetical protein
MLLLQSLYHQRSETIMAQGVLPFQYEVEKQDWGMRSYGSIGAVGARVKKRIPYFIDRWVLDDGRPGLCAPYRLRVGVESEYLGIVSVGGAP